MAMRHIGRPLPNAALLGGFAALSGLLAIDSVAEAIRAKFPERVAESNIAAAREAYGFVRQEMREVASAAAD
jgi:pyruvate ferredoxin oxidoreductase gamma subunit